MRVFERALKFFKDDLSICLDKAWDWQYQKTTHKKKGNKQIIVVATIHHDKAVNEKQEL